MENYCPHCGEPLKEDADFCLSCGKLVHEKATPQVTRYQAMSKTAIAIIGFFVIVFFINLFRSFLYSIQFGYVLGLLVPAIFMLLLALTVGIIAILENNNRQVSKEMYFIALTLSIFFILTNLIEIVRYFTLWSRFH